MNLLVYTYKLLFYLIILGSLFINSCDIRDDDYPIAPPDAIYEIDPESDQLTGSLGVYVFSTPDYEPLPNTIVSLYTSYNDFDKDIYLQKQSTNRDGFIDFSYLIPGNYYLFLEKNIQNDKVKLLVQAQVQIGKHLTRNIVLY